MTNNRLKEKITEACHRIEDLYYKTDGHCYVSFSGGKDSTVLLASVKMCEASVYWLKDMYIARDVELPFDEEYEKEQKRKWAKEYDPMRKAMLEKYRPNSKLLREYHAEEERLR